MPLDESVLGIPAEHFEKWGQFLGFRQATDAERDTLLDPRHASFRPRSKCETDPGFKQLIPYVVLRCGNHLFQYRRGSAGTEKRLQSLRSIGIGGHISTEDAAGEGDPYRTGMLRELTEEVQIRSPYTERFLGFIYDDRTPVGSVHLGVVHLLELESPNAASREDALADAGFVPADLVMLEKDQFETWSQFVLDVINR
jgi:predicted NUDIX family phosphoesterase